MYCDGRIVPPALARGCSAAQLLSCWQSQLLLLLLVCYPLCTENTDIYPTLPKYCSVGVWGGGGGLRSELEFLNSLWGLGTEEE